MAQLKLDRDIVKTDGLVHFIEENFGEVESALPGDYDESALSLRLRRESKRAFSADFHARLFGRLLVVSASDANVFQAINRARRHLIRQIEELRRAKRQEVRHRPGRRDLALLGRMELRLAKA